MEQNRKLAIRNWSVCDRPTYKLHECGASTMTDAELLSIIIGSGTAKYNALEIAKMALGKYENNLNSMGKADVESLTEIECICENTAIKVMAAFELGKLCSPNLQHHAPHHDGLEARGSLSSADEPKL